MSNTSVILQPILNSPDMGRLLEELNRQWQLEQERRHRFWETVDGTVKAEFINGEEIMYHSPVYGRHWMASTQLMRYMLPYVYDNHLGKVGYEKVMIRCTRNDYEPDACFWNRNVRRHLKPAKVCFHHRISSWKFFQKLLGSATEALKCKIMPRTECRNTG